jgi:hypothetical protein
MHKEQQELQSCLTLDGANAYLCQSLLCIKCQVEVIDGHCCRPQARVREQLLQFLNNGCFTTALGGLDPNNQRPRSQTVSAVLFQLLLGPKEDRQVVMVYPHPAQMAGVIFNSFYTVPSRSPLEWL